MAILHWKQGLLCDKRLSVELCSIHTKSLREFGFRYLALNELIAGRKGRTENQTPARSAAQSIFSPRINDSRIRKGKITVSLTALPSENSSSGKSASEAWIGERATEKYFENGAKQQTIQ